MTVSDGGDGGVSTNAYPFPVARLRLFAAAREAAGTSRAVIDGSTVDEVLATAATEYGVAFGEVVENSRVWLNGEPAEGSEVVGDDDEIAVLPPVSGGC